LSRIPTQNITTWDLSTSRWPPRGETPRNVTSRSTGPSRARLGARGPRNGFDIVWVGDVLLGSSARKYFTRHGYQWPFAYLRPLLRGDYLIGNAEGPITEHREKFFPDQRFSYRARPAAALAMAQAGFNAMSLSNNHCLDRGPHGLTDSIERLTAVGITPFGAGEESAAASPLLIDTPHGRVAVLGIGQQWRHNTTASATTPGTIALSQHSITAGKTHAAAAGARWVIAYVHWGANYQPVTTEQRHHAAMFARAGYDLVIGTGSHTAQPVEIINNTPILYSLGNFTFGTKGRFTDDTPGYGLVARTTFTPHGLLGIELSAITTDNRLIHYQPRLCSNKHARELVTSLGPDVIARRSPPLTSWSARMLARRPIVGHIPHPTSSATVIGPVPRRPW
jgi:poly-gamma-glutamate synthesis protein (capsule biosynthesis protein)